MDGGAAGARVGQEGEVPRTVGSIKLFLARFIDQYMFERENEIDPF